MEEKGGKPVKKEVKKDAHEEAEEAALSTLYQLSTHYLLSTVTGEKKEKGATRNKI